MNARLECEAEGANQRLTHALFLDLNDSQATTCNLYTHYTRDMHESLADYSLYLYSGAR